MAPTFPRTHAAHVRKNMFASSHNTRSHSGPAVHACRSELQVRDCAPRVLDSTWFDVERTAVSRCWGW
eukprot:353972-Chlamydomonas_euryale.AAC.3